MRRLLPALALCSVAQAAWAQADAPAASAQIYGLLDAFAGSMRRSDEPGRTKVLNSGGMTTSFWGIRGAESLGGGLQAQFALESFFQVDSGTMGRNSTDPYFSRNAWVGLAGGFGQVALGRQTNPMFVASGAFNPFGTSLQFSPVMLHTWQPTYNRAVIGDSVWSNALQYTSPTLAGLRASVLYSLGEVTNRSGVHNLNLTLNYAAGPFAAVVSAQQAQVGPGFTTAILRQDAALVGASYDLKAVQLYGQFQRTRTPDIRTTATTAQLGAAVPVGAGRFLASVARTQRKVQPATETHRTTWAIGYDHFLSKRTDLYAVYMRDRLTGFDGRGSIGVGMRHRF
ncbi:putative porin [Variovorax boronicumulans]|uniref:porin n=1 Tax=Variovorax boronicumulans TaxID=436515 RepID=UPI0027803858|nr:porin [Variovorax boronicumulans]MDQ0013148.1 putative porin [Variovorax boronicumulans]